MEIAMAAIRPLIPKLGELLVGEFTLEKRVKKGVESLVREMTLMQAALRKVGKVPADQLDEGTKIWAGMVRELSYQMEDIVDSFMVCVEDGGKPANPKNRVKKLLKKTKRLFKKGKDLHRISDALEEVFVQARQLGELRQRYEQETRDSDAGASVDPRVMALYTDVTKLVGVEEPRDKLIDMLIEGDDWSKHPLKTVSIVGFGGMGKTTLAKAVYDKLKVQFDCGAFVSVSQNPDIKKVFKNILYEFDKCKYAHIHNTEWQERHLIDEIIEFLNDKRYLIVIDDIWNEKSWELIKCAFSKKSHGSKLITTTRIVSVSEACCSSSDDIYRMKPLSNDLSRRLFCKRVFSHEEGCPKELVQVSEDILKKCGGIPLAIITISSLMANKHRINTKEQWYALLNSIGRGLAEDRSVEEMKKILLFSYYDLPSYLRPCLLYLSIFPEDSHILRDKLIWKWIAEGFVYSENQESSLYELGKSYFNELVNRSMISPIDIEDNWGEKEEACSVHDMVLDLICSISSEENFVTILDCTKIKMSNSQSKVRRLSIQNSKVDVETTGMAQVRSLFWTNNIAVKKLDISRFQLLRVLDLEGCDVSDIEYVGNLLHLRYLGLKGTDVQDLPMEIGSLQFLLTLDLRSTWITELPSSIVQLRHLMCLYIANETKLPPGICNLTSLEVLGEPVLSDKDVNVVKELGHLTKLRVLRFGLQDLNESLDKASLESLGKAVEESLGKLCQLDSLYIVSDAEHLNLMSDSWVPPVQLRRLLIPSMSSFFQTLPAWINPSSLPLLAYLSLTVDEVRSEDIRLLGMMPALCSLMLICLADSSRGNVVEVPVLSSGAFPCATECYFVCIDVVPSMFPRGAAPRLKRLSFTFPAKWISHENIDLGMRHLPSLEEVDVSVAKEEASDWEVDEAKAALRAAVEDHPNRPVLDLRY
ncbi:disease resistance protein RGA5-like isoform X2 [Triticum dicoccoides]|nr:disease resistance protein RGA5-like isoform X2 [Triticum dicoccoides]